MTSHIAGVSPGTAEGTTKIKTPSPTIASASGTLIAAFRGRSFWATGNSWANPPRGECPNATKHLLA
jgi:hypothetical protein